ncbi:MAG: hypothetical protein HRF46_04390 [Acidobacteriota bacterium]
MSGRALPRLLVAGTLVAAAASLAGATLTIEAPPSLHAAAARLGVLVDDSFAEVLALVGLDRFGPPVRVVLAGEDSELARRAPSWVAGYAQPVLGEVVLFPGRVPSYPDRNLEVLLRHEVAHVLASRAAGHRPLPTWLAEGIATVAAREWGLEDRARYAAAVIGPGPRSFRELDAAFHAGPRQVARAYALSAAVVRALERRHGPGAVARLLARLAAGDDLPDAFRAVTGVSLASFERRFFRTDAFWTTWVPFLTSSAALWMGITLLALLAIRRRRQRDAQLRARWAAEEAGPSGPADHPAEDVPTGDPTRYN